MDLIYDANTALKIFNMNDAQKFKFDMLEKYPEAKFCALSVTLKGTQYEILQIMLDANLNPIKKKQFHRGRASVDGGGHRRKCRDFSRRKNLQTHGVSRQNQL